MGRGTIITILLIIALTISLMPVSAQETAQKQVIKNLEVSSNENPNTENSDIVLVKFNNLRERSMPVLIEVDLPKNIEVTEKKAENGYKKKNKNKWLFNLNSDQDASLSLTVQYKNDEEYQGEVKVSTDKESYNNKFTINERKKIENIVDKNNNYYIDDSEIINAISDWTEDGKIEDRRVDMDVIKNLINLWKEDINFTPAYPQ